MATLLPALSLWASASPADPRVESTVRALERSLVLYRSENQDGEPATKKRKRDQNESEVIYASTDIDAWFERSPKAIEISTLWSSLGHAWIAEDAATRSRFVGIGDALCRVVTSIIKLPVSVSTELASSILASEDFLQHYTSYCLDKHREKLPSILVLVDAVCCRLGLLAGELSRAGKIHSLLIRIQPQNTIWLKVSITGKSELCQLSTWETESRANDFLASNALRIGLACAFACAFYKDDGKNRALLCRALAKMAFESLGRAQPELGLDFATRLSSISQNTFFENVPHLLSEILTPLNILHLPTVANSLPRHMLEDFCSTLLQGSSEKSPKGLLRIALQRSKESLLLDIMRRLSFSTRYSKPFANAWRSVFFRNPALYRMWLVRADIWEIPSFVDLEAVFNVVDLLCLDPRETLFKATSDGETKENKLIKKLKASIVPGIGLQVATPMDGKVILDAEFLDRAGADLAVSASPESSQIHMPNPSLVRLDVFKHRLLKLLTDESASPVDFVISLEILKRALDRQKKINGIIQADRDSGSAAVESDDSWFNAQARRTVQRRFQKLVMHALDNDLPDSLGSDIKEDSMDLGIVNSDPAAASTTETTEQRMTKLIKFLGTDVQGEGESPMNMQFAAALSQTYKEVCSRSEFFSIFTAVKDQFVSQLFPKLERYETDDCSKLTIGNVLDLAASASLPMELKVESEKVLPYILTEDAHSVLSSCGMLSEVLMVLQSSLRPALIPVFIKVLGLLGVMSKAEVGAFSTWIVTGKYISIRKQKSKKSKLPILLRWKFCHDVLWNCFSDRAIFFQLDSGSIFDNAVLAHLSSDPSALRPRLTYLPLTRSLDKLLVTEKRALEREEASLIIAEEVLALLISARSPASIPRLRLIFTNDKTETDALARLRNRSIVAASARGPVEPPEASSPTASATVDSSAEIAPAPSSSSSIMKNWKRLSRKGKKVNEDDLAEFLSDLVSRGVAVDPEDARELENNISSKMRSLISTWESPAVSAKFFWTAARTLPEILGKNTEAREQCARDTVALCLFQNTTVNGQPVIHFNFWGSISYFRSIRGKSSRLWVSEKCRSQSLELVLSFIISTLKLVWMSVPLATHEFAEPDEVYDPAISLGAHSFAPDFHELHTSIELRRKFLEQFVESKTLLILVQCLAEPAREIREAAKEGLQLYLCIASVELVRSKKSYLNRRGQEAAQPKRLCYRRYPFRRCLEVFAWLAWLKRQMNPDASTSAVILETLIQGLDQDAFKRVLYKQIKPLSQRGRRLNDSYCSMIWDMIFDGKRRDLLAIVKVFEALKAQIASGDTVQYNRLVAADWENFGGALRTQGMLFEPDWLPVF